MAADEVGSRANIFSSLMESMRFNTTETSAAVAGIGVYLKENNDLMAKGKALAKKHGAEYLQIFTMSELILQTWQKIVDLDQKAVGLQRRFGLESKATRIQLAGIVKEGRALGLTYDATLESVNALYDVLRDSSQVINKDMINAAHEASIAYGVGIETSSRLIASTIRFGGSSAAEARKFVNDIGEESLRNMVDSASVMDDIAANFTGGLHMARSDMIDLAIFAQKAGTSLGTLTNIQKGADSFEGAVEMASKFAMEGGLFGEFTPEKLLYMMNAPGGMQQFTKLMTTAVKGVFGPDGSLGQVGRKQLERISEFSGFSYDELTRMGTMNEQQLTAFNKDASERAAMNRSWGMVIESFKSGILAPLDTVAGWFSSSADDQKTKTLEIARSIGKWLPYIAAVLVASKAIQTAIALKSSLGGMFGGAGAAVGGAGGAPGALAQYTAGGGNIGKGVGVIGRINWKAVGAGAVGMIALAGSLWILSKAVQNFVGIDWSTMAVAGVALAGLVVGLAAVGGIMLIPGFNVAVLLGAAALVVLASSFWVLSKGAQNLATAMTVFVPPFVDMTNQMVVLGSSAPQLLAAGAALVVIAGGLAAFSAGGALAGLSNFLFGDPFKPFIQLADHSVGLLNAANALESISISVDKIKSSMRGLDLGDLKDLGAGGGAFSSSASSDSGSKPIMNRITIMLDGRKIGEHIEETLGTVT